jgi:6-pyruvoyltetrahydropterin/6-carboxytetrahydropterin synthase
VITVTKQFAFSYAHFLPGHKGVCANLHGHSGVLEIEVGMAAVTFQKQIGPEDIEQHMVMDFSELKNIVNRYVISKLDHVCLNNVMAKPPTAENIVFWVRDALKHSGHTWISAHLTRIRCYETSTSWAEWRKT